MSITIKKAKKEHEKIAKLAKNALDEKKYSLALSLVSCAANQAYHLNYCYADKNLENILIDISNQLFELSNREPNAARYVFYDDFGYDNRGLTQQYLHALDSFGVNYLYIVDSDGFDRNGRIAEQIRKNPNAILIQIPQKLDRLAKLRYIFEIIYDFNPEKAFLHLNPWSSVAVAAWNAFPKVERYLIDLTDHAFWLGVSCSNYFIGFRSYGNNISKKERKIDPTRLLNLPYYPISANDKFQGFPTDVAGRVKIFSGATYYKIYGENDAFFKIIQRIVKENPDAAIIFAGSGDVKPFKNFIDNNGLSNNVYLIGNRSDINSVFKNCDIYLNTYPIIGGLMSQYAVLNNKPLIGYTSIDIPCNESEGLFAKSLHYKTTYFDIEDFHASINHFISSSEARNQASNYAADILPTPESFSIDLNNLLAQKKPAEFPNLEINIDKFAEIYTSMENNYLHKYDAIKFRHLGFQSFFCMPLMSIASLFNVVAYNFNYIFKYFQEKKW